MCTLKQRTLYKVEEGQIDPVRSAASTKALRTGWFTKIAVYSK